MEILLEMDAVERAARAGERFEFLLFWGHHGNRDGELSEACLSQWWPARFTVSGQSYFHAEQFMMAEKARLFGDSDTRDAILTTASPKAVKALGRQVRGFDDAVWNASRFDVVTRGNVAKFGDNAALREYLLATRDRLLVEASPVDRIWGIGLAADHEHARTPLRWRGLNLLGFALMRARAILRGDLPPL